MNSLSTKKTVVTGGAGFIGSHLVETLLDAGDHVVVIDNYSTGRKENIAHLESHNQLDVIEADITKINLDDIFTGADWVIHLAALADIVPSILHPETYFETNVVGTMRVVQAAQRAKVKRFVYSASSSCYGIPEKYPTPETTPISPQYPYALTKHLGEETAMHWGQVYGLPMVSLRLFNVFGPRSRTSGAYGAVFGVFLAQKLAGKPFTVVGDGSQSRDFTFVSDVVNAFVMAAESSVTGEFMNVGSDHTYSVNRLVELLGGEVTYVPKRPGEPDITFADTSKIKSLLGWSANVSFEDGVQEMLNNIEYWREAPVWTPSTISVATEDWFKYLSPA